MEITTVKWLCLVSAVGGALLLLGCQALEERISAWWKRRHQVDNALLEAVKALSKQVAALPQAAAIEALVAQVQRLEKRGRGHTTPTKGHINGAAASSTHTQLND